MALENTALQNPLSKEQTTLNEITLEMIITGMLQTCGNLWLSETLGTDCINPFLKEYKPEYEKIIRAVFSRNRFQPMSQDDFLYGFLDQLKRGGKLKSYQGLAAHLDSHKNLKSIRSIVKFLGIRYGSLYCAFGVHIKEESKRMGIVQGAEVLHYIPKRKRTQRAA